MNKEVAKVTERVIKRSAKSRASYLKKIDAAFKKGRSRELLGCSNLAHGVAACPAADKEQLTSSHAHNIGIITSYNDMLSAHQPFERFPKIIQQAARNYGATAQVAGATPAMCDGVTQGQDGMELSLFSRDVIAMSTAVGLSHNMYDAALLLGICDKIVPGLMIGALSFGHLPMLFVPGGPMRSGLPNKEKATIRRQFAENKITTIELLKGEMASYHSPGTCTFYGTANSNQMFMELMGLHAPGSTFVNPDDPMRDLLTQLATKQVLTTVGDQSYSIGNIINEKAIINAVCGLLATGGSTNHTIHLVAIAKAAGVVIDWQDFDDLSHSVPLLARVYPNGSADVNHFRDAGGLATIIHELTSNGLMHDDVMTMFGKGLSANYLKAPVLANDKVVLADIDGKSTDTQIISSATDPFSPIGGLKLLTGNLGRSICKISAVPAENLVIKAPAVVVDDQQELLKKFKKGLDQDLVAVVRHQGICANGMPELHKLTASLSILQNKGRKVALVTDGRMSGASGTVLAAIHLSPEATIGGPISRIQDGDIIELDCHQGTLNVLLDEQELKSRATSKATIDSNFGCGRELFKTMRDEANSPEEGGTCFLLHEQE